MSKRTKIKKTKKEYALDIVKDLLTWIVITGGSFLWWLSVLLIISLVLMNVWHTSFEAILRYTIVLTAVTSVLSLGKLIYDRVH